MPLLRKEMLNVFEKDHRSVWVPQVQWDALVYGMHNVWDTLLGL